MNDIAFADACERQYLAALEMLGNAVERCPEALWNRGAENEAPFWRHAMHVLFYARLYLLASIDCPEAGDNATSAMRELGAPLRDFSPAEVGRLAATMGGLCDAAFQPAATVSREQILGRLAAVRDAGRRAFEEVRGGVGDAPNPMPWMTGTRADLLLYNLRHIQHHVGRLHAILGRQGVRLNWVGGHRMAK